MPPDQELILGTPVSTFRGGGLTGGRWTGRSHERCAGCLAPQFPSSTTWTVKTEGNCELQSPQANQLFDATSGPAGKKQEAGH